MIRLFSFNRCKPQTNTAVRRTPEITRTFVETGDERCPIAGIWSRIGTTDAEPAEPEIARPVIGTLLPWRASHRLFNSFRYSIA